MAVPNSAVSIHTESPITDASIFYELISTKKMIGAHHLSLSTTPNTSIYTVKAFELLFKQKPSILLHAGDSTASPVFGVVKLHSQHSMHHTIGVGNPEALLKEGEDKTERMIWERLQRVKKWNYRWYELEFEGQVYTWRRTADRWYKHLKNMELRVGREEDGKLVAVWKGSTRINVKRGSFFLRRREEGVDEDEARRFEVVALLTGLAIIEAYMRRAR
jgi:hypothetical protein